MSQSGELTYAYFFICDIVGLSNPQLTAKRQIKKVEALTSMIKSSEPFKNTDPSTTLYLPTGDGMAIGFLQGPELPLMLSIDLHKKLKDYNVGKFTEDVLQVRIGISAGQVVSVKDALGNTNVWGPGFLLARTIMDIGDDLHILLGPNTATTLRELSPEYKELIKPLHDFKINEQRYLLYSAYSDGVGNRELPANNKAKKNMYQVSEIRKELQKIRSSVFCREIDLKLTIIDPKTMLTHHSKFYNIENKLDEPLQTVLHCIRTSIAKKYFNDLHIRVSDESGAELKIASINYDKPRLKEFTTRFEKPIEKGEKGRGYRLEYEVEERKRYYEFQPNICCKKYSMSILYPSASSFKPVLHSYIVKGKMRKRKSKISARMKHLADGTFKTTWETSNVTEDQVFCLEW